jgi:hypothetical protein
MADIPGRDPYIPGDVSWERRQRRPYRRRRRSFSEPEPAHPVTVHPIILEPYLTDIPPSYVPQSPLHIRSSPVFDHGFIPWESEPRWVVQPEPVLVRSRKAPYHKQSHRHQHDHRHRHIHIHHHHRALRRANEIPAHGTPLPVQEPPPAAPTPPPSQLRDHSDYAAALEGRTARPKKKSRPCFVWPREHHKDYASKPLRSWTRWKDVLRGDGPPIYISRDSNWKAGPYLGTLG